MVIKLFKSMIFLILGPVTEGRGPATLPNREGRSGGGGGFYPNPTLAEILDPGTAPPRAVGGAHGV